MVYSTLTAPEVAAAGAVFLVLCTVITALRLAVKLTVHRELGVEDWLIIPAWLLTVGICIATLIGVSQRAIGYLTPPPVDLQTGEFAYQESAVIHILYAIDLMQVLGLGLMKTSLVFFYRAIFASPGGSTIFSVASIITIVLIVLWTIAFLFAFMLNCPTHLYALWTSYYDNAAYCWPVGDFLLAYAWSDFVIDCIVLFLPIPLVLQLHMNTKKKITVIAVFILGGLAIAASVVRAALFTQFVKSYAEDFDIDMLYTNGIYWILIETGFSLCAINMPIIYNITRHQASQRILKKIRDFTSLRSSGRSAHSDSDRYIMEPVDHAAPDKIDK